MHNTRALTLLLDWMSAGTTSSLGVVGVWGRCTIVDVSSVGLAVALWWSEYSEAVRRRHPCAEANSKM